MARIRSVKPELRTSAIVRSWPIEVRYFWVLLWGYLDDYGRGHDAPKTIAGDCFPTDDRFTSAVVDKWLALMTRGLADEPGPVCRYRIGGNRYLHAVNWKEHQRPNRPTRSRIPPCPLHEHSLNGVVSDAVSQAVSASTRLPESLDVGAAEQQRRGAEEQQQTPREQLPATANRPSLAAAAKIIQEHLEPQGCTEPEAHAIATRIAADKRPRNLGGLVRTLARAGDLDDMLAGLRDTAEGLDNLAAIHAARQGPACPHGEPGGAELHPKTHQPLCPLCRADRKRALP